MFGIKCQNDSTIDMGVMYKRDVVTCEFRLICGGRSCFVTHPGRSLTWLNGCSDIKYAWWHHQKETFSALLALVRGIHRSPVNSPHKANDAELRCFLWSAPEKNIGVNNGDAGDLRRQRTHYDVTVMGWHLIDPYYNDICYDGNYFRIIGPLWLLHQQNCQLTEMLWL